VKAGLTGGIASGKSEVARRLAGLGAADGVHLLHSMGDTFALMRTLEDTAPATAIIVGAGYIGLEMADALTTRGLRVTQIEQLPEVLPTVDPELGILVRGELEGRGVRVLTSSAVREIGRSAPGEPGPLRVDAVAADGTRRSRSAAFCSDRTRSTALRWARVMIQADALPSSASNRDAERQTSSSTSCTTSSDWAGSRTTARTTPSTWPAVRS